MQIEFVTVEVALGADTAELQRSIALALRDWGAPLRWAITAVDEQRQRATVEAVVTTDSSTEWLTARPTDNLSDD